MSKNCVENPVLKPTLGAKCLPEHDSRGGTSMYNYYDMGKYAEDAKKDFLRALTALRTDKGVSSREMSLSLGQGASYINDIENGRMLPSLSMFFEICEYFRMSPAEFFGHAATRNKDDLGVQLEMILQKEQELIKKHDDLHLSVKIMVEEVSDLLNG